MKFKLLFLVSLTLLSGCSTSADSSKKNKIIIETSTGHSIQEGASGFNVRIADKVWSYTHPDFREAVHGLQPGWLRYFSGTMGDAFNSATGLYDIDYAMMFDHQKQYFKGYEFTQVKGPHRIIDLYELLGEVGGKLIVTINAFSETPQVAKELAQFCKNNNIEVEAWQFCNEPYFYVPHRELYWWNDGYDYAVKMKPYAEAIKEVFPDAQLALNFTWDGIWGFMKEIHKYQEEHGAYWNTFSKHSYAPHIGGKESFEAALRRANTKVIEATSAKAMQQIEDYTWEGVPMLITEFGVWNRPLNGIISAIYNAEYTLRQLEHPNASYIGSHEISNKYKPAKNLNKKILEAYKSGESINADELLTGIFKDDEGKAIELVHEATNNSVFTINASIENNVKVKGLKGDMVDAMYARAFKGINGSDYLLVTNRSGEEQKIELEIDGVLLNKKVKHKYMYSELAQNKNIPLHEDIIKASTVLIRPYSVNLIQWKSSDKYAPTAPRIYKSRILKSGIELDWWKREIADGYAILYGTDKQNLDIEIDVKNGESVLIPAEKLKSGQKYFFAVKAYNKQGESEFSELITRTWSLPEKPVLFKTARRDTTITVMWESVANADGYKVFINDGKNESVFDAKNVFGYRVEGLEYEKEYQVAVAAYNGLGLSEKSDAKMLVCKKHLPYPPRNISANETVNGHVSLEWVNQDTINPGVRYRLYRGEELHDFEVLMEDISSNTFIDKSIQEGKEYYYTVKSYNADGECNFYPNIATVIKLNKQISLDVKSIALEDDYYLITVTYSNIKLGGDIRYGVAVSDISYLNVEEDLFETQESKRGQFMIKIPKEHFKKGRTYAVKGFINKNGKSIYSLPPHKNIKH